MSAAAAVAAATATLPAPASPSARATQSASSFTSPGFDRSRTGSLPDEAFALGQMIAVAERDAAKARPRTWREFVPCMYVGMDLVLYMAGEIIPAGKITYMPDSLVRTTRPLIEFTSPTILKWIRPQRTIIREGPACYTIKDTPESLCWNAVPFSCVEDIDQLHHFFHTQPAIDDTLKPEWLLRTSRPTDFISLKQHMTFLLGAVSPDAHYSCVTQSLSSILAIASKWSPRPWPLSGPIPKIAFPFPLSTPTRLPTAHPIKSLTLHPAHNTSTHFPKPITIGKERIFTRISRSVWNCEECARLAMDRTRFIPGFHIHLEDLATVMEFWAGSDKGKCHYQICMTTSLCPFHSDPNADYETHPQHPTTTSTTTAFPTSHTMPSLLRLLIDELSDRVTVLMARVQRNRCLVVEDGDLRAQEVVTRIKYLERQLGMDV